MIKFENVHLRKKKLNTSVEILTDITFEIRKGSVFGIAGLSGSGKTSIVKLLSGVYSPSGGKISVDGVSVSEYIKTRKIQTLFQNNNELINPLRTVEKIIEEVLSVNKFEGDKNSRINELLSYMDLDHQIRTKRGYELSGGQQQRVALVRILAAEPEYIIMDEPFSAQDIGAQNTMVKLIESLNQEKNKTIIVVAHDFLILQRISESLILLKNGMIEEYGEVKNIIENPGSDYTKLLLKSQLFDIDNIEYDLSKIS